MKKFFLPTRFFFALLLCLAFASPALASDESHAALEDGLKKFASDTIASINRCVLPSEGKKEVISNGDGTFTARYIAIDIKSVNVSIKKADRPGPVSHIGYMRYCENEFACTASSKAAAQKGPFKVMRTENLTELVKYMNGKWTY